VRDRPRRPPGRPDELARASRVRLDQLLVDRGLAESRSRAQALILAGRIRLGAAGEAASGNAGELVDPEVSLSLVAGPAYVSRGGQKLVGALDAFLPVDPGVDPADRVCLDVGASTGGFTDVLLRRGARRVYALDVGRGQLAQPLREDARVVVIEGVNARHLSGAGPTAAVLPEPVTLATIDVSFISLVRVLAPVVSTFGAAGGRIVALVKPQFEAGRGDVHRGVVRDAAVHERVLAEVKAHAEAIGLDVLGEVPSPLLGPSGNREFFLDLAVTARP
jgi:23S rRNA (cytidine1920-2'-O)/16S rRNA (cytidine1409-2'-O)-methyltransferase